MSRGCHPSAGLSTPVARPETLAPTHGSGVCRATHGLWSSSEFAPDLGCLSRGTRRLRRYRRLDYEEITTLT